MPLTGLGHTFGGNVFAAGRADPGGEGDVGGDQEGLRSGPPRRWRTRRSREGVGSYGSYAASSVALRVGRTLARFYGSTLKLSIIPLSWCSAMWQCAIHRPGLVMSSSRSTVSPVRTSTVSFQTRLSSVTPS